MVFDLSKISGIGDYSEKTDKERKLFYVKKSDDSEKPFLIVNKNTFEIRCDQKLSELLINKYESVMESRYFGKGGIEIVPTSQLEETETNDLIRLSYNLTKDL